MQNVCVCVEWPDIFIIRGSLAIAQEEERIKDIKIKKIVSLTKEEWNGTFAFMTGLLRG